MVDYGDKQVYSLASLAEGNLRSTSVWQSRDNQGAKAPGPEPYHVHAYNVESINNNKESDDHDK